jgi:ABC-type multidrug transport system ATPase subunit
MLSTLLPPTTGEARICGLDIRRQPGSVRRTIGYMPDTYGVYDDMRVWEYLDFFARMYAIPAPRRKQIVANLLELVDLGEKRDAYVQALSRGMQQRLCLAHALVHDPKVLLLDEPASGLDPRARAELRELLRELSTMGKTIVISSHILPELEEVCTAVAIIDRGRVLAAGRIDEIQARFRQGTVIRARVLGDAVAVARPSCSSWLNLRSPAPSCWPMVGSRSPCWVMRTRPPRSPSGRCRMATGSAPSVRLRPTWRSCSCRSLRHPMVRRHDRNDRRNPGGGR